MQKVEGSSPFSRFAQTPAPGGGLFRVRTHPTGPSVQLYNTPVQHLPSLTCRPTHKGASLAGRRAEGSDHRMGVARPWPGASSLTSCATRRRFRGMNQRGAIAGIAPTRSPVQVPGGVSRRRGARGVDAALASVGPHRRQGRGGTSSEMALTRMRTLPRSGSARWVAIASCNTSSSSSSDRPEAKHPSRVGTCAQYPDRSRWTSTSSVWLSTRAERTRGIDSPEVSDSEHRGRASARRESARQPRLVRRWCGI